MDLNMFNDRTLRAMGSQYQTSGSEFYYPNYSNYNFAFTSMYIKHDFNYFVFKGGRIRTPKWGQGLLLDGGRQRAFGVPYSTEGIHLSLDPEKGQAFGLFTGYDILVDNPAGSTTSGAKDVPKEHRFFFGVQSDSIQREAKKTFTLISVFTLVCIILQILTQLSLSQQSSWMCTSIFGRKKLT